MRSLTFAAALAGLGLSATASHAASQTAVFAGGCFWSVEKFFEATPGVISAVSGYSGGSRANPTYENHAGHLEAVRVTYDPAKITYAQLVDRFYHNIDPTDPNGQICDQGPSYRTAVFVATPEQRAAAEAERVQSEKQLGAKVTVRTLPASTFWPAETYHQDFAKKNPTHYERYRVGCGRDRVIKAVWAGR